jgi:hypothetical protein
VVGRLREGLKEFQNDEAKAVDYADSVVRMTQGSGSPKDLPAVQQGGELHKTLTMFYSYLSVLNNMSRRTKQKVRKAADLPRATLSYLYLWAFPSVMGAMILGQGPDDDEEWLTWAAKRTAAYPFMSYVIVRDVVGAMTSGYNYRMSPVADALGFFADTGKHIGEGDFDEGFAKSGLGALGIIGRVPTRQAWITGDYLSDYFGGEVDEFSIYDALVTGHRE